MSYEGTQKQGWVLTSRKDEMPLSGAAQPDGRITNDAKVLSILGSANGPMTAVQIAEALLAISGDPQTEVNIRRAVYRVRDHLRDFAALGALHIYGASAQKFGPLHKNAPKAANPQC